MLTFRHIQLLFLFALSQDELISYIKPRNKYTLYSDSYNGSELTHRVEIALLRLYRSIFSLRGDNEDIDIKIDNEINQLIIEMRFINSVFLEGAEIGRASNINLIYNFSMGKIFWNINRRYAKLILERLNIDLQKPRFCFYKTLEYFNLNVIEVTEEEFMTYLYTD